MWAKHQDIAWQRSHHTDWPSLFLNRDPVWSWTQPREPPEPRMGLWLAQVGQRLTVRKLPRIPGVKTSVHRVFPGAQDRRTVSSPRRRAES